jgi:hypothetical protein
MSFDKFLKELNEGLYSEFKKDLLLETHADKPKSALEIFEEKMKVPDFIKNSALSSLKKVSSLSINHPCKKYVTDRQIPSNLHFKLFYCHKFKVWTNSILPNKFSDESKDESRLIIPLLTKGGKLFGYQGRSLNPLSTIKYITIILDSDYPRLYGMDTCNFNHRYYAVEGPIDSMFVNNCVASAGSDITSGLEKGNINKDNAVVIYDNEARNPNTVKKMKKAIRKGYSIVIWPDNIHEKDINDMFLSKLPIQELINGNIYKGLEADLRMTQWVKTKSIK